MLDMDIWRKTDTEIQLLHLEQFKIFLQHSHKSSLNVKRLSTMRKLIISFPHVNMQK